MNSIAALVVFIISLIFLYFAIYSMGRLKSNLVALFALMNFSMACYSFGYAWELTLKSTEYVYMAIKVQYFGLAFLSIYWLAFAYKFKTNNYPSLKLYMYLAIVPCITFFLVVTNEVHGLFHSAVYLEKTPHFLSVTTDKGFFYYIFILYSYSSSVYILISLYKSYKGNRYSLRLQNKLMVLASIMPMTCNLLYLFKLTPHNFDPTPFGFLVMSFYMYRAVFKYSFLDLKDSIRGLAFNSISEGILVLDNDFRIVDFNSVAQRFISNLSIQNIGNSFIDFPMGKTLFEKKENDKFELSIEKDSKIYIFEFKKNPVIVSSKVTAFIYIFSDITLTKDNMADLSFIASHDFLTGLYNRRSFTEEADKELARVDRYGGELSIIMLDIDFFKKVNDTYGHIVGDEVLKRLSNVISNNLRATDTFGRLGGEEFCILLPQTTIENAKNFAEKIRKIVEIVPFYWEKGKFNITISLGISYYSKGMNDVTFEAILDLADKALYKSKNNGRNQTNYMQGETTDG